MTTSLFLPLIYFAGYFNQNVDAVSATLSNTDPRLDTNGHIVNAHDGNVQQWETNGKFYWYAMAYSECMEPSGENGCSDAGVNNSCGFQYNHTVYLYTSSDLSSGSWQFVADVLPLANRYQIYTNF